jgi:hypothetical protein
VRRWEQKTGGQARLEKSGQRDEVAGDRA